MKNGHLPEGLGSKLARCAASGQTCRTGGRPAPCGSQTFSQTAANTSRSRERPARGTTPSAGQSPPRSVGCTPAQLRPTGRGPWGTPCCTGPSWRRSRAIWKEKKNIRASAWSISSTITFLRLWTERWAIFQRVKRRYRSQRTHLNSLFQKIKV